MKHFTLLHGFTGRPSSMHEVVPVGCRFQCLEILGHGAASNARSFGEEVDRLCKILAPETELVGYSMGGRLALAMALQAPKKIRSLTVIGASPGLATQDERDERRRRDENLALAVAEQGMSWFVNHWESLAIWTSQQTVAPALLRRQRSVRRSHSTGGIARALRVLGTGAMPSLWGKLSSLSMPTRIVSGALDRKYYELGEQMKSSIRNASHHVAPKTGHNVALEAPGFVRNLLIGSGND